MPITLNNSNISVTYNTGSNYIIETVKSDLYVRGTTSGNLSSEPTITSPSFTESIRTFTHSNGSEAQTTHTITIGQNTICDILIIAGGGGGGNSMSGGGGAGGMVIVSSVSLSGVYTIRVGKGGIVGFSAEDGESDGKNSEIFSGTNYDTATNKIRVIGGGGGGHEFADGAFDNGNNGGCGGGGKVASGGTSIISLGGTVTSDVKTGLFSLGVSYGNAGGNGSIQQTANNQGGGGGGGCGLNQVGGTGLYKASADTSVSLGGKGGNGLYVGDIFGTNIGVSGWVGGGGGGGSYSGLSLTSFQENTGGQGGGGRGGRIGLGSVIENSVNGVNGTGGGGGGGRYDGAGANGGSGIVIIKFRTIVNAAILQGITHKNLNFTYSSTPPNTYTLTFPVRTLVDVNNNSNLILQGDYNVNVGHPTSSLLPAITNTSNTLIPLPLSTTSNVSIRYHLLNPIKTTEGAQWTYSSSNANVYYLGSVGIGTTSPEYSLDVRGFIYSSSGGYTSSALTKWSVLSDRRIKENIVKASYDKCLENVKNIELYNFNFKDNYVNTNDRHQLGFIAQEVQKVYPKAVEFSRMIINLEEKIDDLLTLNTTQIDYTLYGAVKCLIQKLENIKIKMEQIKTVYNITT